MEDKQLDFNAPLLSVRRFSSEGSGIKKTEDSKGNKPYVPPYYKSDLKSGPMRHAGTVPFVWEQIPGRCKFGEELQDRSIERPPVAPKLPPGRTFKVKTQSSDKELEEMARVISRQKDLPTNGSVSKLESSKDGKKEKKESYSEDGDEVYADALDTLSRSESFLFNCSVSGISGLEETNANRSGTSTADLQTRDFMMDRFLPAAKAMASEAPHHASWKQPVTHEPPIIVKKVANGDKRLPLYQYKPYVVPQYVQEPVEEESEDEDDDYSDTGNSSAKACGLFPKFCLKNSLFLMNPVPGMKVRSRGPIPSARKFSTNVRTTYSGSHGENNDANNWEAVYKHKRMSSLQPLDDESKVTSESTHLTYWTDSQTPEGSSSHMHSGHSGGGGISPFRNEANQSTFHEGMGFLGVPKQVRSIKMNDSTPNKDIKWGSGSLSPMVEKTLYVDSENLQPSISHLNSSDTNGMNSAKEKKSETSSERRVTDDSPSALSSLGDTKIFMSQEKGIVKTKMTEAVGSNFWSSSDGSNPARDVDRLEGFRKGCVFGQGSRSLMSSKVDIGGNREFDKTKYQKEEDDGNSNVYSFQLPLPPPLPKSPSESWLWRTLPSVSSKNGTSFHPRKQSSKTPSIDPKWETIVKTSNVHHSHLRFSEELATPLPPET